MHSPTSDMLDYIVSLARHFDDFGAEQVAIVMLMDLGIEEKHDSFDYLRLSIILHFEDSSQMITKVVYPMVARQSGRKVSGSAVERAIRKAIDAAWRKHNNMWDVFFPSGEKPTNGQFIARIARYIELWKGCCEVKTQQSRREVL